MRTLRTLTAAFVVGGASVCAQPFAREAEPFPVHVLGSPLAVPCTGGFNSPQHQFVDIDSDSDLDLFVLDVDLSVNYYRNEGTRFQPVFRLRNELVALPTFRVWFRFVDLDGDGRIDLCTEDSTFQGVRVYKNTGTLQSPQFTMLIPTVHDTSGADMFAGANSMPAFIDIDRDNDFDFFSSNITGTINFYRNVGTPALPQFAFVSASWENILIFGDTCTGSSALLRPTLHGAASYSFADIDGDNDYDMFVGDLYHSGIFTIRNTGTPQAPHMECGTAWFPPNQPLLTGGFNHTSFVDMDGDGDIDLFATPLAGIVQRDGFIFYRNNGTANSPLLQFVTANFITTIDVGLSARPAFADIDGDGDPDMFVGNIGA
ncbi:MAG TPA: VCBS repeat-containing protein, partial [Bacteroidota bacterium]|nr:VCBS repeat-containing protein [Bacteroidota bacterium]